MEKKIPETERFYGRRAGKTLRSSRQRLIDGLLPKIKVAVPPDLSGWHDIWLEVGFGAGEHLAWQAVHNPETLMIGCEPFINGVARLLDYVETQKLDNVRIHPDDARPLLDSLPDSCLGRVFVLFNDPWPKKRHHHRRFINPHTLDRLARVMKAGAELRVASDNQGLVFWMIDHIRQHGAFEWKLERCHEWLARPSDWPPTRYEQKRLHGRPVFLRFTRKESP